MSKISAVKGFADLFMPESALYTYMESVARRVFGNYGYEELRIPIVEYTDLFQRSIGTETDVVQKEMFTMADRKGRSITMRPEATAGILRSYIEHNVHAQESMSKLFSYGPMFRYERPQKGRMRQFHQLDCECLGSDDARLDAEMLLMLSRFLGELGLHDLTIELNTLGCRECRPAYREKLINFLRSLDINAFCEDCKRRIETSPLRVLDCKVPGCKTLTGNAPKIHENVCEECSEHFSVVRGVLDANKILYKLNPKLVRGLDYYMRTTFEVISDSIGAQGSVAGGGRYDDLIQQLGGSAIPGIGFACGMERLALCLGNKFIEPHIRPYDFYIVLLEKDGADTSLSIAEVLRGHGLKGKASYSVKSMKSQMRYASKLQARFCLLLGETELSSQQISIKDMDSGEQITVAFDQLPSWANSIQRY